MPFVTNLSEQEARNNPSIVLSLIEVVDLYSSIATNDFNMNVLSSVRFLELSGFVKQFTPCFLDYTQSLLDEWVHGIRQEENSFIVKLRERIAQKNKKSGGRAIDFYTPLPQLLFKLMGEQLQLIAQKLSGQNLFELIKLMLKRVQVLIQQQLQQSLQFNKTEDLLILCLRINNFHRISLLARQFQAQAITYITQSSSSLHKGGIGTNLQANALANIRFRAQNFLTQKFRKFNLLINKAIQALALFIINDINNPQQPNSPILLLFKSNWFVNGNNNNEGEKQQIQQSAAQSAYQTFSDYLKSVQKVIAKDNHLSQVIYYLITYYTQAYFQALLIEIDQGYNLQMLTDQSTKFMVGRKLRWVGDAVEKKKSKKKIDYIYSLKDKKGNNTAPVLFDPEAQLTDGIARDLEALQKFREKENKKIITAGTFYMKIKQKYFSTLELLVSNRAEVQARITDFVNCFKSDETTIKSQVERSNKFTWQLITAILCVNQNLAKDFDGNYQKKMDFIRNVGQEVDKINMMQKDDKDDVDDDDDENNQKEQNIDKNEK